MSLTYDNVRLYLVEGDSKDKTYHNLIAGAMHYKKAMYKANRSHTYPTIVKYDTGVDRMTQNRKARLKCLSDTANKALEAIHHDCWAEKVMLLESDLLYHPDLIERLLAANKPVVAPNIILKYKHGSPFYDVWAFRLPNGKSVGQKPVQMSSGQLIKMQSVGSVVMYDARYVYEGFEFDERAIRGLCEYSGDVWWDTSTTVWHPPYNESTGLDLR
jgi:hypothetical protein